MTTTTPQHQTIFIDGPAGPLQAIFWTPPPAVRPPLAAVVCHPHPLYGGHMHNKVVYHTAKTLHAYGLPVLRFNFRGVGESAGVYDRGIGEMEDVVATLDFLAAQFPGFSFGSWVGMRVGCSDTRVTELIGLGLPVNDPALNFGYLLNCGKPKLLLMGANDQYADQERVAALAATIPGYHTGETRLIFVPQADHFFTGRLDEMTHALAQWLIGRHPELAQQKSGAQE
jgi:hypothetical protein